jgi:hypothetical protein
MLPYLSTSRTEPGRAIDLGPWHIPLGAGKVVLLRRGAAFWETLERHGIETTIVRAPANFPPSGTATHELCGMGTPDLLGTYGIFTLYTTDASGYAEIDPSGGRIVVGERIDGVFRSALRGPDNPMRRAATGLTAEFAVYEDPAQPLAKLVVGDESRLLEQGEWTDWVPVSFRFAPARALHGMCRFYLQQLRPTLKLYASPINLDPMQPALPISRPPDWAAKLATATGRFYTAGMPEDTKAYSAGVFGPDEFLAQARLAADEHVRQYRYILDHFHSGLLFQYFGTTDLVSHMMWRSLDPGHPAYDAGRDARFADVIPSVYADMDAIVGYTLAHVDPATTIVVMSDHGFTSWRRVFHLNAWLMQEGYLAARDPHLAADAGMLSNIDWEHTRAYGLGLNGLYVNLRGRERWGIVAPESRPALLDEIAAKLLATRDPATGAPAVTRADRSDRAYSSRGALDVGPDLIVGYAKGTRCADPSALGTLSDTVFSDNTAAWSGDHCMDYTTVPGILLANRPLARPAATLTELGASILAEFGVAAGAPGR